MSLKNYDGIYGTRVPFLIGQYLDSRVNLSASSSKNYKFLIMRFFEWCARQKIRKPNRRHVIKFISDCLYSECSATYTNSILVALNGFFKYLSRIDRYPNICEGIDRAREKAGHKRKALKPSQFKQIIEAMPRETPSQLRDYAIILLIGHTGIRRHAVSELRCKDLADWVLTIRLKGHKDKSHVVPLSDDARRAILDYLASRARPYWEHSPLFATSHRNLLKPEQISRIFKRAARAAGIDDPQITCHSLRHMFATVAKAQGVPLENISKALGHSKMSTTADVYTRIDESDVDDVFRTVFQAL